MVTQEFQNDLVLLQLTGKQIKLHIIDEKQTIYRINLQPNITISSYLFVFFIWWPLLYITTV